MSSFIRKSVWRSRGPNREGRGGLTKPSIVVVIPWLVLLASCGGRASDQPGVAVPGQVQFAPALTWGDCVLSWQAPIVPVDSFEVQVSVPFWEFSDGSRHAVIPGTATSAEMNFGTWNPELTTVSVSLRAHRGVLVSAYSASASCTLPIRPPWMLAAVIDSSGIDVSWRAQSTLATSYQVERSELDAARQPGAWITQSGMTKVDGLGSTVFVDTTASVGKAYGYRVTAIAGTNHSESKETTTLVFGAPLQDTTIQLPKGNMVTDGGGHYAYISSPTPVGAPDPVTRFTWGDGTTWTSADVDGIASFGAAKIYAPGMKLDAQGLPHVVYTRHQASGDAQIIHGSPNGAVWREDVITVRSQDVRVSPVQAFDLDTAGNPMIVWMFNGALEAASKSGGAWQVSSLAAVYPNTSELKTSTVFADQAGTVHLLIGDSGAIGHASPIRHLTPRAGAWTSETLPVPAGTSVTVYSRLLGVGHDPDHLAVCFQLAGVGISSTVPACCRKTLTGWGNVEQLGTLPFTGGEWEDQLVLSPDGRRLALLSGRRPSGDDHVFRSDDAGAWSETIAAPWQFSALDFTTDGKFQIFSYHVLDSSPLVTEADYLLETEP
jgi:hypothetical protein